MWSFLNPVFLWALAAALIPLILHLMQKRRIITVRFSTLRFLKLAHKRSSRRIRLENFLLWLLRTLIMLLIALAFALPILRITSFKQLMGGSRRDVAIVWDVSYSMDYMSGRKKIWDTAKDTLLSILEGLQHGDRACIFLADDDMTPLIEQPTADLEMALAQIKSLEVKTTTSSLCPAIRAACTALKDSQRREREIHIITDGQRLPWEEFNKSHRPEKQETPAPKPAASADNVSTQPPPSIPQASLPWNATAIDQDITFFVTALGVASPVNSAPLSADIQPALMMADCPAKLLVKLGHTGPAENISVSLILNNQEIDRHSLMVENEAVKEVVFVLPALPAGVHSGRVETSEDGLPIDNTFYFLLRVNQKLPVLCIGTEADAFFLMRALNPSDKLSAMDARRINPDALGTSGSLKNYTCIFLCNAVPMSGQAIIALEDYVQRGGLIVFFPGDRGTPADYESWGCLPALPRSIEDIPADHQRRTLRLMKPGDPLFTGMKLPPGTFPTITMNREIQWTPLTSPSETVIAIGNNRPFLIRRAVGLGHVLCFSISADRRWSTMPLSPFFLPLVHQIVQYGANVKKEKLFLWTCRHLILNEILGQVPDNAELRGPSNEAIEIHKLKSGTDVVMSLETVTQPGLYHLHTLGKDSGEPVMAVNVVRTESDLVRINFQDMASRLGVKKISVAGNKEDLLRMIKEHRVGRPLGEQLLWLAFMVGMLELFLANRASRKTSTLSEQLMIENSGRVKGKATD